MEAKGSARVPRIDFCKHVCCSKASLPVVRAPLSGFAFRRPADGSSACVKKSMLYASKSEYFLYSSKRKVLKRPHALRARTEDAETTWRSRIRLTPTGVSGAYRTVTIQIEVGTVLLVHQQAFKLQEHVGFTESVPFERCCTR